MAEGIDVRELIENEADKFIGETGKFPKCLLLGYEYYLRLYEKEKRSVLVPVQEEGKDVGSVDICKALTGLALDQCEFDVVADPDHKHRLTFLVDNQFSSQHQAKEVQEAIQKIQEENKENEVEVTFPEHEKVDKMNRHRDLIMKFVSLLRTRALIGLEQEHPEGGCHFVTTTDNDFQDLLDEFFAASDMDEYHVNLRAFREEARILEANRELDNPVVCSG